jgi:hypothetical protein
MGQALHVAIREMKAVPEPHTEHSNIADMEFLKDNLFPMFSVLEDATAKYQAQMDGLEDESDS